MPKYWDRGNRSEWLKVSHEKGRTHEQVEAAKVAMIEIDAMFDDDFEPTKSEPCKHENMKMCRYFYGTVECVSCGMVRTLNEAG